MVSMKSKIFKTVLWHLPKKTAHKIMYYRYGKKKLNLENPQTIDEKIQYMIVNDMIGKQEAVCTDKYLVRQYIKDKGYESILPKLFNTFKNANDINLEELPEKFVLKTNNGSGDVFICENKEGFEKLDYVNTLNKNLKTNYAKKYLEYHYTYIDPLIICEEYLEETNHESLIDYKIWCFDGVPKYILVCLARYTDLKKVYYDTDWNYLDDFTNDFYPLIEKPKNFDKMLKIASDLSSDFKMVRVDLYNINGKIYFSELTFTPSRGIIESLTEKGQILLGNELHL